MNFFNTVSKFLLMFCDIMDKNLIIAILLVVVVAGVGVFAISQHSVTDEKINTQITFLSQTILQNGDQVQFELKDVHGAVLAGQNVTISYDDGSGNIQNYNIITDANGKGYLTISGENAGNYNVTVTYNGNNQYNGSTAKQIITIEDGTSEDSDSTDSDSTANTVLYNSNSSSNSSSSSSGSQLHYDSKYNVYYDDDGIIRGGQNDGYSVDYIIDSYENGNMVDEDGNLQ